MNRTLPSLDEKQAALLPDGGPNLQARSRYGSVDDLCEISNDPLTGDPEKSICKVESFEKPDVDLSLDKDKGPEIVYPEGGVHAWLTVFGAFCTQFCSFGWINTFGIFQQYYLTHQLENYSPTAVSWISSLQSSVMFMGCLFVGRLFDSYGPRYLLPFGTILQVVGIMVTSVSTSYPMILVFHGIVAPIGAAFCFNTAVACVSSWFKQKRSRALGIMSAGSSIGGIIYPFLIRKLETETSFGWLMRSCGFLILALLIVANFTIRSNLEPRGYWLPLYPRDLWTQFKDIDFSLISISYSLGFVGFTLPFTYIVSAALFSHVNDGLATYLVSILNACSIFGRLVAALYADRVGPYNINTIGILLSGIATLAFWIPAQSTPLHVIYSVVYGFASGIFVAMIPACTAKISAIHDIGTRVGLMFACLSLANLAGVPIGGVILGDATLESRWRGMMAFAGVFLVMGGVVQWIARVKLVGPGLWTSC
ncbi:major facilitator superfamily domain-containing protein [Lipomyces oligophaga]|uniref:major facilitator superfamily domain-containing protein n=1 Tax=Lipomyces oligophaga TaxID=45792 RepID=UPI0034CD1512